jgi:hypothetical protein
MYDPPDSASKANKHKGSFTLSKFNNVAILGKNASDSNFYLGSLGFMICIETTEQHAHCKQ